VNAIEILRPKKPFCCSCF